MLHRLLTYCLPVVLALVSFTCKEHIEGIPAGNQTPKTFLWLYPQTEIRTGISKRSLHWWGEDPDGAVRGFLFSFRTVPAPVTTPAQPDTVRYVWTTSNDTTILFPLDTLFRRFAVTVRAVDNSFRVQLPAQCPIRLSPFAYADSNDNAVFDTGDRRLEDLPGAMDPLGSTLTFPVRNSPPTVNFLPSPFDPTVTMKQPDVTYTAATFAFSGSDPDGNNTLRSYRIALNDTSSPTSWLTLALRDTIVTLVVPRARSDAAGAQVVADIYSGTFLGRRLIGQLPGLRLPTTDAEKATGVENVFYVQVKDVAGEYSPVLAMPSGGARWRVKKPQGRLLLVSDYIASDGDAAHATYLTNLAGIPGGEYQSVDELNIGMGLSATEKSAGKPGPMVPPFVDPALIQTFLLYDYVFWYTDQYPSLSVAQLSLFSYMQNGGKVLFSTTFQNTVDPRGALNDFAPIDSVSSVPFTPRPAPGDTRIPANYRVFPDSSDAANIYPQLAFNQPPAPQTFFLVFMRPIYRRSDARYIYHLQRDTLNTPPRYIGMPNVAAVDGQRQIVFVGLPLHLLNNQVYGNPEGLQAFFTKVFTREFNPLRKVNRMKF